MSPLRLVFLALTLWGTVHPMYHFIRWMAANGWSLQGLIDSWFVHAGTEGLVWDLTIAAITLTLWVLADCWQRRDWLGLVAIPATYCIGVSCGLPLFLLLRSRPL